MTDVTREGPLEVLQDLHAAIERGAELEARIATGDKRAAWELVALEKEMGWERPAGPPRKRHPGHWLLLDGLLERDRGVFADGIREAVADGILPVHDLDGDGELTVREEDFEAWQSWYSRPTPRHCPACGHDLKGEPPKVSRTT